MSALADIGMPSPKGKLVTDPGDWVTISIVMAVTITVTVT